LVFLLDANASVDNFDFEKVGLSYFHSNLNLTPPVCEFEGIRLQVEDNLLDSLFVKVNDRTMHAFLFANVFERSEELQVGI
jgi:hypothetical protein